MEEQKRLKLEAAIRDLPSRQLEALFLRFYEGIPYEEIAEVMQITVSSAHKTIYKALTHLRAASGLKISLLILLLSI